MIGRGRYFVSTAEAARLLGVNPHTVWSSLQRARQAGKILSVTKGGWIPVPPEYRRAGAPPPIHYIDQLMGHLGHVYYVGFLSAGSLYGASHQVPMVLQVVTNARLRDRRLGGGRIQFLRRGSTADRPTRRMNVPTGRVTVSTPEITVFDLVEAPRVGAGLSNVATVIGDLLLEGQLDSRALAGVAETYPTTVIQRAGHLIKAMAVEVGIDMELSRMEQLVAGSDYTPLHPGKQATGSRDNRWRVHINVAIDHDL